MKSPAKGPYSHFPSRKRIFPTNHYFRDFSRVNLRFYIAELYLSEKRDFFYRLVSQNITPHEDDKKCRAQNIKDILIYRYPIEVQYLRL
jgi:hypothetical protein